MPATLILLIPLLLLIVGAALLAPGLSRSLHKIVTLVQEVRRQLEVQSEISQGCLEQVGKLSRDVVALGLKVDDQGDRTAASILSAGTVGEPSGATERPAGGRGELNARNRYLSTLASLKMDSLMGCLQRCTSPPERSSQPTDDEHPLSLPAVPRSCRGSVVFLHHSYYHFYYLAQALRRRGFEAVSVSIENPSCADSSYYHGEDIVLYDDDPGVFRANIDFFFKEACRRFELLHFANDGWLSFFPEYFSSPEPPDILEWRSRGKKIAYTVSGCSSCVSQSSTSKWSSSGGFSVCDSCIWQNRPDVCADDRNLEWGRKVDRYCDLIFGETVPALDYLASDKVIREPVCVCLDPSVWRPDLDVPDKFRMERKDGEVLVYHSVGNFDLRAKGKRNIKGTPAVVEAVERLQAEGFPVRLVFVTGVRNLDVKYTQVQADIIVDQLNYGRYGATCREAMMLGKPVICNINPFEHKQEHRLKSLEEIPAVSATPQTLYTELKRLVRDRELRERLGREGRKFALKWHGMDACAERYERVYHEVMTTGRVASWGVGVNEDLHAVTAST